MPTLRAAAKLNLFLHINGRRADGYHLMESFVVFTELADELHIEAANTLSLTVEGEFACDAGVDDANLVLKAAHALQQHTGCTMGARMRLTKNIPVGTGLGGGSADAAAALRGLNTLWALGLDDAELKAIATPLGADVPMCLASTPALARGIGDELTALATPLPTLHALLVHPRAPLLTKDVYAAYAQAPASKAAPWHEMPADVTHFLLALARTRNHLQPAAIRVSPLVAEVLLALETVQPIPDLVRMTGSGACCFALYSDEACAQSAHARLQHDYPNWFICLTRIGA